MNIISIIAASVAWFVIAGILFFNPIVDKIYRSQETLEGVRSLPKSPRTMGMILAAIFLQIVLWAWVYSLINPALPGGRWEKGLVFGLILVLTKMIPRDIDRILLTSYPRKRMLIEFVIGSISVLMVGMVFGYLLG